jgi:hypothetical protein
MIKIISPGLFLRKGYGIGDGGPHGPPGTGDHKGPPRAAPPPSPLRTDKYVSKKPTDLSR